MSSKKSNPNRVLVLAAILFASNMVASFATTAGELPAQLTLKSENLQLVFTKDLHYTITSLKYKGVELKADGFSGTVINISGVGWIGSGHTEVENEKVLSLEVFSDNSRIDISINALKPISGKVIKVVKTSKIRDFTVTNTTILDSDAIREISMIKSSKETKLYILYNFMHSWINDMNRYMAMPLVGKLIVSEFVNDNKFPVRKNLKWVAFYSDKHKTGIITKILRIPPKGNSKVFLWDRYKNNKFYLSSFFQQMFKSEEKTHYEAITSFCESDNKDWKNNIKKAVEKLEQTITTGASL